MPDLKDANFTVLMGPGTRGGAGTTRPRVLTFVGWGKCCEMHLLEPKWLRKERMCGKVSRKGCMGFTGSMNVRKMKRFRLNSGHKKGLRGLKKV